MMRSLRRAWPSYLIAAAALAILWVVLRSVSLADAWAALRGLTVWELALLALANGVVLFTMTARWWYFLFTFGHRIPYLRLVSYRLAAFGVSYFTPGPHFGGEPLQVYLVSKQHQVPTPDSIAAVALDKVVEMLANFTFLVAGALVILYLQVLPPLAEGQMIVYAVALLSLPVLLIAAMWHGVHPVSGFWRGLQSFARRGRLGTPSDEAALLTGRFYTVTRHTEDQVIWLCQQRPAALAVALAISALNWAAVIGEFWLMTAVLDLNLSVGQAVMALVAARVAILLPVPAAIGTLEVSQVLVMGELGLNPALGISLSALIRARDVTLGLLGLWIGGSRLWREAQPPPELAALMTPELPLPVQPSTPAD